MLDKKNRSIFKKLLLETVMPIYKVANKVNHRQEHH